MVTASRCDINSDGILIVIDLYLDFLVLQFGINLLRTYNLSTLSLRMGIRFLHDLFIVLDRYSVCYQDTVYLKF